MHILVTGAATALLLLTSVAGGVEIAAEADPAVDFSGFRTFAWASGTPAENPEVERHIASVVERELTGHGFVPRDAEADLLVAIHTLVDRHTLQDLHNRINWEFWTGVSEIRARDVGAGTLVVDLVDPDSGRIVWRGLVTGAVTGSAEKMRKKLDRALVRLFQRLPRAAG